MPAIRALPLVVLLASSLGAQDPESATIGVQARISHPEAGLRDLVGGGIEIPGVGLSLVAEFDMTEGYRLRVDFGGDRWSGHSGVDSKVFAYHLGVEGVMMLRPDDEPSWGPYILAGLGGYAWSVGETDAITGGTNNRRIMHVAGTVGIGFRLARTLDVELKALGGRIDPKLFAAAVMLGVTFRY